MGAERGGSGPASDRDRLRLGPEPRQGCHLPERDPDRHDGSGVYRLTVKDVPVDGFWSISVYDAEGHFVKNDRDAYTLNSVTGNRDPMGRRPETDRLAGHGKADPGVESNSRVLVGHL